MDDDVRSEILAKCKTFEEPGIEDLHCGTCDVEMHTFSHFNPDGLKLVAISVSCSLCGRTATFVPCQADRTG